MTFLNPAVLIGLAAASIPILIHLLNLRKLKTIEFSTLIFLRELQKNKIRRVKLKQLLLLALLVLIILMIVTRGKIRNKSMFLILPIAIFFGLGLVSLAVDIIASVPHRYVNYAIALAPAFAAPVFVRFFNQARR